MSDEAYFKNRSDAGIKLASKFSARITRVLGSPIVLGIPRGGIPVGYFVAKTLGSNLEAIALRKLPIPSDPEAGFGAVTLDRTVILNQELISRVGLGQSEIDNIIDDVYKEVLRRSQIFAQGKDFPQLKSRTVVIVDDGLATGYTMLAAVKFVRSKGAREIITAVPVAHSKAYELIKKNVDEVVVLHISKGSFFAVASYYGAFPEMTDKDVLYWLNKTK